MSNVYYERGTMGGLKAENTDLKKKIGQYIILNGELHSMNDFLKKHVAELEAEHNYLITALQAMDMRLTESKNWMRKAADVIRRGRESELVELVREVQWYMM